MRELIEARLQQLRVERLPQALANLNAVQGAIQALELILGDIERLNHKEQPTVPVGEAAAESDALPVLDSPRGGEVGGPAGAEGDDDDGRD